MRAVGSSQSRDTARRVAITALTLRQRVSADVGRGGRKPGYAALHLRTTTKGLLEMTIAGFRARRRRPESDRGRRGQGRFESVLFSFMGPPQLGENRPPAGYVPDEAANLCHKCGRQWDVHERVHTGTMT